MASRCVDTSSSLCRSSHHWGTRSAKKNGTRASYLGDLRHHALPAKEARFRWAQGCIGPSIDAASVLTIVQGGINGALHIKVSCLPGQRTCHLVRVLKWYDVQDSGKWTTVYIIDQEHQAAQYDDEAQACRPGEPRIAVTSDTTFQCSNHLARVVRLTQS